MLYFPYILQLYLAILLFYLIFLQPPRLRIGQIIQFFGFIFYLFCYTPSYFLSSVNIFIPHLSPRVFFPLSGGFIFINLFICPPIYALINIFNFINNQVKSVERENFIKIKKESFGTPIPITPQFCWGVKFIIKESQLEQNFLFIINISICAKGKWKAIFPFPSFKEMRKGGNNLFIIIKEPPTLKDIYFLEVN